jgi:hypothetical protein
MAWIDCFVAHLAAVGAVFLSLLATYTHDPKRPVANVSFRAVNSFELFDPLLDGL